MTVLDTLNFVAFNPLQNNNPIAVRRRKLIAKIDEQIQPAANKDYTPTQHKWVTDEHGNQRKADVAKRVKRWWTASVDGKQGFYKRQRLAFMDLWVICHIQPFGSYLDDSLSLFMEKHLVLSALA